MATVLITTLLYCTEQDQQAPNQLLVRVLGYFESFVL